MQSIIYLHGFLSSPQSLKAQQTLAYAQARYPQLSLHMPVLSGYPDKAIATVEVLVAELGSRSLRFIGSSMGGFLATHFVEKYGGKAVLINPAVNPVELLIDHLGEFENPNTGEVFKLSMLHLDMLKAATPNTLKQASHYKVLLQKLDETLDYRLAEQRYAGADLCIEEGGDHAFQNFDAHLDDIFPWLLK